MTKKQKHQRDYRRKIKSEGALFLIGHRPKKLTAHSAAVLRKLGEYVDSADVEPPDKGLLSRQDAENLRAVGVLVLDEEIDEN